MYSYRAACRRDCYDEASVYSTPFATAHVLWANPHAIIKILRQPENLNLGGGGGYETGEGHRRLYHLTVATSSHGIKETLNSSAYMEHLWMILGG